MADELSEDELELIRKHRAAKAKKAAGRKVTVRGRHDSGAEYSFDLDGDEAERIISRHRALWADEDEDEDQGDGEDEGEGEDGDGDGSEGGSGGAGSRSGGSGGGKKPAAGKGGRGPYFKRG